MDEFQKQFLVQLAKDCHFEIQYRKCSDMIDCPHCGISFSGSPWTLEFDFDGEIKSCQGYRCPMCDTIFAENVKLE